MNLTRSHLHLPPVDSLVIVQKNWTGLASVSLTSCWRCSSVWSASLAEKSNLTALKCIFNTCSNCAPHTLLLFVFAAFVSLRHGVEDWCSTLVLILTPVHSLNLILLLNLNLVNLRRNVLNIIKPSPITQMKWNDKTWNGDVSSTVDNWTSNKNIQKRKKMIFFQLSI